MVEVLDDRKNWKLRELKWISDLDPYNNDKTKSHIIKV